MPTITFDMTKELTEDEEKEAMRLLAAALQGNKQFRKRLDRPVVRKLLRDKTLKFDPFTYIPDDDEEAR